MAAILAFPTQRRRQETELPMAFGCEACNQSVMLEGLEQYRTESMVDFSPAMRVKRGFHRTGIGLAAVLGACIFAIGAVFSTFEVNDQQRRSLALRCAYEQASLPNSTGGPWERYRAGYADRAALLAEANRRGILPADMKAAYQKDMATLEIGGRTVRVDGSFLSLTRDQQDAIVDEIWRDVRIAPRSKSYGVLNRGEEPPVEWATTHSFRIGQMGCGNDESLIAAADEIFTSPSFSYSMRLARDLGITAIVTGVVALLAYFSSAGFSWIVRGFMRD
jgi:hypothetical protein